jgi:hypothetical protein
LEQKGSPTARPGDSGTKIVEFDAVDHRERHGHHLATVYLKEPEMGIGRRACRRALSLAPKKITTVPVGAWLTHGRCEAEAHACFEAPYPLATIFTGFTRSGDYVTSSAR